MHCFSAYTNYRHLPITLAERCDSSILSYLARTKLLYTLFLKKIDVLSFSDLVVSIHLLMPRWRYQKNSKQEMCGVFFWVDGGPGYQVPTTLAVNKHLCDTKLKHKKINCVLFNFHFCQERGTIHFVFSTFFPATIYLKNNFS